MYPYSPPSSTTPGASISMVAIGILTFGTIGLCSIAAVLCGVAFYEDCGFASWKNNVENYMALSVLFGIPLIAVAYFGAYAGISHLRRRSKLSQIPMSIYVVTLTALVAAWLWGGWFSIYLICCVIFVVVSSRSAIRYQHAVDGWAFRQVPGTNGTVRL